MGSKGGKLSSFEAVKSSEGGVSLPVRGNLSRVSTALESTALASAQSQNLILHVWKADWSDSISCIHLESHNM